jgi:hypothetical protein
LYYDVSLQKIVELDVVIPTSPRTSKIESGYSNYSIFILVFLPGSGWLEISRVPTVPEISVGVKFPVFFCVFVASGWKFFRLFGQKFLD